MTAQPYSITYRMFAAILAMTVTSLGSPTPLARAAPRKPAASTPADQALDLARTARKVYEAGQFAAAAEMWRKAFRLDPSKPDYLYGVGKAEQRAGELLKAKAAFEQLLALVPGDDPLAERSRKALAEIALVRERQRHAAAAPIPAQPPIVAAPTANDPGQEPGSAGEPATAAPALPLPATPSTVAASAVLTRESTESVPRLDVWPLRAALAATIASAAGAGIFAGLAWSADRDADAYRAPGSAEFDPARISEADAQGRIETINRRWLIAGALGGVAALGLGVAGWLKWRDPRGKAAIAVPTLRIGGGGATLAWSWP